MDRGTITNRLSAHWESLTAKPGQTKENTTQVVLMNAAISRNKRIVSLPLENSLRVLLTNAGKLLSDSQSENQNTATINEPSTGTTKLDRSIKIQSSNNSAAHSP